MFAQKLKKLRKNHGLTQVQLAKELNIGTSTIGMYESNIRKPSYKVLKNIADFFCVTVDYLIEDDDKLYQIDDTLIHTIKKLSPQELEQVRNFVNFIVSNPK